MCTSKPHYVLIDPTHEPNYVDKFSLKGPLETLNQLTLHF